MSEERTFFIDLDLSIEYEGDDFPDEESIIMPVKNFIKKHMKAYQKTCKLVVMDTRMYEAGYSGEPANEET